MQNTSVVIDSVKKFYTPEFKLQSFLNATDKKEHIFNKQYEDNYTVVYMVEGDVEVFVNNKTALLSKGDIYLSAPYESFDFSSTFNCKKSKFLALNFLPSLFFDLDKKSKILRPFDVAKSTSINIYKNGEVPDIDFLFAKYNKISKESLPLEAFCSLLTLILFEICSVYDKTHHYFPAKFSDEYDLKIYAYIQSRALTNLKIKDVTDEFFVSDWYVNKVCKKFYGGNFSFMLKSCKMWAARGLIVNKKYNDDSYNKIATACGYSNYSGFFKAYKDYFGLNPKDDKKYFKKTKHFYIKENEKQ